MRPHHLLLTDELAATYDPIYKVNPPLRTATDVEALRDALADGTIDAVGTDHAPHPPRTRTASGPAAAFGMLGLETAVGDRRSRRWSTPGLLDWAAVADRMTSVPRGSDGSRTTGARSPRGSPPTWPSYDPRVRRVVDPAELRRPAATRRTADGAAGRVVATFLRGRATLLDGSSSDHTIVEVPA